RPSIRRGIKYLVHKQNSDGSWTEHETTGTGFPKVFYLKYDMYRNSWPLLALATYRKILADAQRRANGVNGKETHHDSFEALAGRRDWACDALESFLGAPQLPVSVFNLAFRNPVGLAAGMDKNAEALPVWASLGFGFTELGAVTWQAQPGNPVPRVFRAIPE